MYFLPLWLANLGRIPWRVTLPTVPRWCAFAFIRLGPCLERGESHLLGDLLGLSTFGCPGGMVHGGWFIFGWVFWRFFTCIFSGWDVHWLTFKKIFPNIPYYGSYISSGTYPGTLTSLRSQRLVRFGDVLTKQKDGPFFSLWVQSCCFLLKKDPRKELQWTFAWLRDRCVQNWVIFEEFTKFTWHISDFLFGEVLRFFDLTSPVRLDDWPHQKNLTKRTSANDEMVSVFGSCTQLFCWCRLVNHSLSANSWYFRSSLWFHHIWPTWSSHKQSQGANVPQI